MNDFHPGSGSGRERSPIIQELPRTRNRRRPSEPARRPAPTEPVATLPAGRWYRIDLHLHTPASIDYADPSVTPLDILRVAKERALDIVSLTDHNSAGGWAALNRELEQLRYLSSLGRMTPGERQRLTEYDQLLSEILVLPGFEFTATFGFHVLAIFSESTTLRLLEHLLLLLDVPEERFGSGEVGATTDVLRAYEVLHEHGAIVIGAHVNSTHGVAMRGIKFAGQTKISYTQDPHLHALEVTDLSVPGRRTTAAFFDGTKAEYSRRMHCIQGSDAHRLHRDPRRDTNLGVGERVTEVFLPERSFRALKELFESDAWDRVRPARMGGAAAIALHESREAGAGASLAFHERISSTSKQPLSGILRDIVAMANGAGGIIYVGVGDLHRRTVAGVSDATALIEDLRRAAASEIEPLPELGVAAIEYEGKTVLAINVEAGPERPYALSSGEVLVRDGAETRLAKRIELVQLLSGEPRSNAPAPLTDREDRAVREALTAPPSSEPERRPIVPPHQSVSSTADPIAPRTGVEIVDAEEIDGVVQYTMRDLRNGSVTRNVTAAQARKLWAYAIKERERKLPDPGHIRWRGDYGFWKVARLARNERRYNLAYRVSGDDVRIFYGVSEEGLTDEWRAVVPPRRSQDDESGEPSPNGTAPYPVEEIAAD